MMAAVFSCDKSESSLLRKAKAETARSDRPADIKKDAGSTGTVKETPSREYQRIISMAPSITETLFALGLGDRVVGVTRYCDYPPEAKEKTKIGGYVDPNYEAMISIKPDLVIMLEEHKETRKFMEEQGIDVLVVNNKDVAGIMDSIEKIGVTCGTEARAKKMVSEINSTIETIKKKTEGLERPRVLVSVGRNFESKGLEDVYIAGKNGFYDEMVDMAGGVNAYTSENIKYPQVSSEGIIMMDPQVIVDIITEFDEKNISEKEIVKQWQSLPDVSAVKNDRIHVMDRDYAVIPGPRFINILEDFAEIIHPEPDWKDK
jgi:iron complex transport system substrate-binding protein